MVKKNKKSYRQFVYNNKFVFLIVAVLVFTFLIFFLFNFNNKISGKIVSVDSINIQKNNGYDISLKQGELIPASSKIIFDNGKDTYEYSLQNLISDDVISGDYYIEGKSISGNGEGYGIKGIKNIYPVVYFTLTISNENPLDNNPQPAPTEPIVNSTPETPVQNETPTETQPEQTQPESPASETQTEPTNSQTEEQNPAPVTSNVISNVLKTISNLFLGLTGKTISESNSEISGQVSANEPFTYNINSGENVKLLSGSVKTDLKNLDDNILKISYEPDKIIVETTYSESEEGFGKNYLGNEEKILHINLSAVDIPKGKYNIKIIYNGENLLSSSVENNIPLNETKEIENFNLIPLTDEEKKILTDEFGNLSIQTIKSGIFNNRFVIEYELGDYRIQYSYDSNLDNNTLTTQMESDKIKWFRDIINKLSKS